MKVCHLTSAHKRYDVRIFEKECVSLAKAGHQVTLIVNDELQDEIKSNVSIQSTNYKPQNRFDRMFKSTRLILKKAIELDCDIYHFHDPELLSVGKKLKKKGKIVIFDAHEDILEQIKDKQYIPKVFRKLVCIGVKLQLRSVCKFIDGIITVTPKLVEKYKSYNNNVTLITNYPILETGMLEECVTRKKQLCFAGMLDYSWSHERIMEAISDIPGLVYTVAGNDEGGYIKSLTEKYGSKINFIGRIPHNEVNDLYNSSLIGMALNCSTQAKKLGGTLGNTKLFEYMMSGLPIVCTDFPVWKDVVEGNNCGICVDVEDANAIKNAIQFLLENPSVAKQMGENGRKAAKEEYNWNSQEKTLLGCYSRLISAIEG